MIAAAAASIQHWKPKATLSAKNGLQNLNGFSHKGVKF